MIQEVRADRAETCISGGRLPELPVWFIRICFPLNTSLQSHPFLALHVPHQFAIKLFHIRHIITFTSRLQHPF